VYLVVDCETNGLPHRRNSHYTDVDNWPRAVQVGWCLYDDRRSLVASGSDIVRSDGWQIPSSAASIHGITTERAMQEGRDIAGVLSDLASAAARARFVVAHNTEFDGNVLAAEYLRLNRQPPFVPEKMICTMHSGTDYCRLPGGPYGQYKWPTLQQLHTTLGGGQLHGAHDAAIDAGACAYCFFELVDRRVIRLRTRWWQSLFPKPSAVSGHARATPQRKVPAERAVDRRVISGSGFEVTITVSGTGSASRSEIEESWDMGPAPGYDAALHGQLPFALEHVPCKRTIVSESGCLLGDTTTAYVTGQNRAILMEHVGSLQSIVDEAAQRTKGFHRNFRLSPDLIPDLPAIPPRRESMEIPALPATIKLASATKTGRAPKYPLSLSVSIDQDVVVRPDGSFVRVISGDDAACDSSIVHLGYFADGSVGKASVHCWRRNRRWSVDCVTQDDCLAIARIELGKADGSTERFFDYREASAGTSRA